MNVFADWSIMSNTERMVSLLARPLGFDITVERDHGWLDFKSYDFGMERTGGKFPVSQLWVGPLHICAGRV